MGGKYANFKEKPACLKFEHPWTHVCHKYVCLAQNLKHSDPTKYESDESLSQLIIFISPTQKKKKKKKIWSFGHPKMWDPIEWMKISDTVVFIYGPPSDVAGEAILSYMPQKKLLINSSAEKR